MTVSRSTTPASPADPELDRDSIPSNRPVGHAGVRVDIHETEAFTINGALVLLLVIVLGAMSIWLIVQAAILDDQGRGGVPQGLAGLAALMLASLGSSMLTIVSPGDTKVVQFFGRYTGTIRRTGLLATVPLSNRKRVSVKVQNFETNELKVNDADGNPVNIAAIIVWQVADTAKATFAVEKYANFVEVQSESALRHVTSTHPYDNAPVGEETLRGSTDLISAELADEVAARIAIAGLEVVEARISSLAYAPEIAQAMLQRQQASAIIAAREKIVEGAVTMVESALHRLESENIVELDEERKAAMVSNLLVVLCGESRATPVINTGSLYQ